MECGGEPTGFCVSGVGGWGGEVAGVVLAQQDRESAWWLVSWVDSFICAVYNARFTTV